MKIAINGAGIAGPTLAYWLHQYGHEPILIEKAPHLRTGGYLVDFWGIGYDVAEKMGLLPVINAHDYNIQTLRWVNAKGRTAATFDPNLLRNHVNGRFVSIERSQLAAAIYATIEGKVETIFGDSIAGIEEHANGVHLTFEHAPPRDVDLVVGADGLHSRVRELVFGRIDQFEKDLGLRVAVAEVSDYHPQEALAFICHAIPGRQVSRLTKHDNKTMFLFGFRDRFEQSPPPKDNAERLAALEHAFSDMRWECPQILDAIRKSDNLYYDRVSQIHMPHWTKGRTALVGDAAACVSLLAGEGTGLAMAEAYILAGEIFRAGNDYTHAFKRYEDHLMAFVQRKQKGALSVAATFVPNSRLGIVVRDIVTKLPGPLILKIGLGDLIDDIELPTYLPQN